MRANGGMLARCGRVVAFQKGEHGAGRGAIHVLQQFAVKALEFGETLGAVARLFGVFGGDAQNKGAVVA